MRQYPILRRQPRFRQSTGCYDMACSHPAASYHYHYAINNYH